MTTNKTCQCCERNLSDFHAENFKNGFVIADVPCLECGAVYCGECADALKGDGDILICANCNASINECVARQVASDAIRNFPDTI